MGKARGSSSWITEFLIKNVHFHSKGMIKIGEDVSGIVVNASTGHVGHILQK